MSVALFMAFNLWIGPGFIFESCSWIVSVNYCHAVFSLLDFLTHEAGTDRLSQNFGAELPLYAV